MKIGVQRRIARGLEQLGEQREIGFGGVLLIEVEDQHAVVANPGELMLGIAGHQTGAHPADFATAAIDLKLGTPGQGQNQLVIVMSVFMGLVVQTQQAGIEHRRIPDQARQRAPYKRPF